MHIEKINRPLFDYEPTHPARAFLESFIECRQRCVGKDLYGIDQEWFSISDKCVHRFSSFAYEYLSFDVELDGWLTRSEKATESESLVLENIPKLIALLVECRKSSIEDDNFEVLKMCDAVLRTLDLWKACIEYRLKVDCG